MSIARDLAQFIVSAQPNDASAGAERIQRLSMYDWMLCGIAGAGEPVAKILRHSKAGLSGGHAVFGADTGHTAADAALINGATSHALDYDDTHFAHIGHPSTAVFPAAYVMGQNGANTVWAALLGSEVSVRVGLWLGRSHYQTGFHQTATAGAFGATAAAGRLLGLSHAQMEAALGVAATQAAGLKSQFGTMGKPYHAGLAARTGVEAALLAQAGFDTRGAGMDGPQGFGPTHAGEGNLDAFEHLGQHWHMQTVSHKFHACCHGLHAMLEALRACPREVDRLEVHTHPRWLSVCNIPEPASGLECKFSYGHTAAMVLRGHDTAALDSYTDELAHDAGLVALRQHVQVIADDSLSETQCRVVAHLGTGKDVTLSHDLDAPIDVDMRAARLRDKGRALVGDVEPYLWQATNARRAPNMDALNDLMRGEGKL